MAKRIKVGVIGTGFIGAVHLEALRRLECVDVAALSRRGDDRAREKADELGVPKAYGDWRNLIADDKIDVVHICTANNLHFEMAREALLAKKHVVCEKPLAVSSRETGALLSIAEDEERVNAVCFNIRFYPLVQHLRAMVKRRELGDIFTVRGSYLQDWLLYDTDYNWRVDSELSGPSRAVADIGSHLLDLIQFTTGLEVTKVCADFGTMLPVRKRPLEASETFAKGHRKPGTYEETPIGTEDYASLLLGFNQERVKGVITVSQVNAGRKNQLSLEISGSKKTAHWNSESPNHLWIGHRDRPNELVLKDPNLVYRDAADIVSYPGGHNEGFADTFKQLFRVVYGHIKDRYSRGIKPQYPTFADGHEEVVLCESILRSSKTKKWAQVEREGRG